MHPNYFELRENSEIASSYKLYNLSEDEIVIIENTSK